MLFSFDWLIKPPRRSIIVRHPIQLQFETVSDFMFRSAANGGRQELFSLRKSSTEDLKIQPDTLKFEQREIKLEYDLILWHVALYHLDLGETIWW